MADPATNTTYPTEIDLLPEIAPEDRQNDPGLEHDVQHDRANAILNALQVLLGTTEDPGLSPVLERLLGLETSASELADTVASLVSPIGFAASDAVTALVPGTGVLTFHMPMAFRLASVMVELTTPQASGSPLVSIDINAAGVSIFTTRPTLDNGERTTLTAATQAILATTEFAAGTMFTVDIDAVAAGTTAKGLKVWFIGTWMPA